jgi:triacylglycerol lipase
MGKRLEQTLAVLNGLVGDYLSRTGNALATDMVLCRAGVSMVLEREPLRGHYPAAQPKVVVLVHGLMCTEESWRFADGSDYGSLLERDLGFSAAYVRYNSGRAIADNGAQLAALLERFVGAYPCAIDELLLIGYSMGGLLVRSACHVAGLEQHAWLQRVRRMIYLGTPHLGAPAERIGKAVSELLQTIPDPYTRLVADIGNLRSSGMKDLGHADLRHEDRVVPRSAWSLRDVQHPLPLLPGIDHHLIAGALTGDPRMAFLFGDSLVPVASATFSQPAAEALLPASHTRVLGKLSHLALLHHPDVYAALKQICEEESR